MRRGNCRFASFGTRHGIWSAVLWFGGVGLAPAGQSIPTQSIACPGWALAVPVGETTGFVDRYCFSFEAAAGERVKAHCIGVGVNPFSTFSCLVAIGPEDGSGPVDSAGQNEWLEYTSARTGNLVLLAITSGRFSFFGSVQTDLEVAATPMCSLEATSLCLWGRFRATADWLDADGSMRHARAVSLTDRSGYFSFFGDSNVEIVMKVLDGCSAYQRWWAFAAGLTNVEVTLTLTDTVTGAPLTYVNPAGVAFPSLQDTAAFPCP